MIGKISTQLSTITKKIANNATNLFAKNESCIGDVFIYEIKSNKKVERLDKAFDFFEKLQVSHALKKFKPIDFKYAESLEEARKFSEKIGIKFFDMGENYDLDILNYFNGYLRNCN